MSRFRTQRFAPPNLITTIIKTIYAVMKRDRLKNCAAFYQVAFFIAVIWSISQLYCTRKNRVYVTSI